MTLLKHTLAPAALAVALFGISAEVGASAVVNKSDLGVSLLDAGVNTDGKGDCDCAESLYGSSIRVSGFHKGTGEDVQVVVITPAAAPATEEIISELLAKTKHKKPKHVAIKDGGVSLRRKASACVFGAANASGCKQN